MKHIDLWINLFYLIVKVIIFMFSANVKSNTEISSEKFIDISELPVDEESIDQSDARYKLTNSFYIFFW